MGANFLDPRDDHRRNEVLIDDHCLRRRCGRCGHDDLRRLRVVRPQLLHNDRYESRTGDPLRDLLLYVLNERLAVVDDQSHRHVTNHLDLLRRRNIRLIQRDQEIGQRIL